MVDINLKTVYDILFAVEQKKQYSNIATNNFIEKNKPTNPSLVREIVYGVIENKFLLDYKISKIIKGKIKDVRRQDIVILRSSIYQIDKINSIKEYTAVNEAVKLAKKYARGRDKFVNAVLNEYIRNKENIRPILKSDEENDIIDFWKTYYSFESWIIKLWIDQFGIDEAEKIIKASNERPNFYIRTNLSKITRDSLVKELNSIGIEAEICKETQTGLKLKGKNLLNNNLYFNGLYSVQDKASQVLIEELEIEENLQVIDVCAAPGGKSLAIAEKMGNTGLVYSRDIYENKLIKIENEKNRLGIKNIETKLWNGENIDETMMGKCHRVLCDVPCSGLGVISKKPEIKYKKLDEELKNLPHIQLKILENSSKYLKENGILIYSTCTINKMENEEVVKKFLNRNHEFKLKKEILLLPYKDDTDGFFIAKIVKEA